MKSKDKKPVQAKAVRKHHDPARSAANKAKRMAREAARQKECAARREEKHREAMAAQAKFWSIREEIQTMPHKDAVLHELHLPDGTPLIKHKGAR